MAFKAHLLDGLSRRGICCTVFAFALTLFICIVVGIAGPRTTAEILTSSPYFMCYGPTRTCEGDTELTINDVATYNQLLAVVSTPQRPPLIDGSPALAGQSIAYTQRYEMDVVGYGSDGVASVVASNTTHTAQVTCAADGGFDCSSFLSMYLPAVNYLRYSVRLRWLDVLAPPFVGLAGLQGGVVVRSAVYTVPVAYTQFQVGAPEQRNRVRTYGRDVCVPCMLWLASSDFMVGCRLRLRLTSASPAPHLRPPPHLHLHLE